jgi:hypothetical protein
MFEFEGDEEITGAFEVTIRSNKVNFDEGSGYQEELIHSKLNGGGKCETEEEMDTITDKISCFLQQLEAEDDAKNTATV